VDLARFYDDYVDRQVSVGVNERHRAIMRWLRQAGLRAEDQVLEIGCGVGTLTELLARELSLGGSVTAVDLSPRSIQVATERLAGFSNVNLIAADVTNLELDGAFSAVVLPDVIEHIPLELHRALFERVARWLRPDGFVLLNYPNPHHLEWCREHTPEVLQAVDQPIHADALLGVAYPHGFYLDRFETYSVWIHEGDYVAAVFRRRDGANNFTPILESPPSLARRVARRLRRAVT
jgi:2-polyprenyl-3-methyl-5-hydroxy-6-metoxy-1,4-benzoquinol methylase